MRLKFGVCCASIKYIYFCNEAARVFTFIAFIAISEHSNRATSETKFKRKENEQRLKEKPPENNKNNANKCEV